MPSDYDYYKKYKKYKRKCRMMGGLAKPTTWEEYEPWYQEEVSRLDNELNTAQARYDSIKDLPGSDPEKVEQARINEIKARVKRNDLHHYTHDEFMEAPPRPTLTTNKFISSPTSITEKYLQCKDAIYNKQAEINIEQDDIDRQEADIDKSLKALRKKRCFKQSCKTTRDQEIQRQLERKADLSERNTALSERNTALADLRSKLVNHQITLDTTISYSTKAEARQDSDNCKAKCRNEIRPKFVQVGYNKKGGPCDHKCDDYLVGDYYNIETFLDIVNEI